MFSETSECSPFGGQDDEASGVTCSDFHFLPSGPLGSTSHDVFLPGQELSASSFLPTLVDDPSESQHNDDEEMVDLISIVHVDEPEESKTETKQLPVGHEQFVMGVSIYN